MLDIKRLNHDEYKTLEIYASLFNVSVENLWKDIQSGWTEQWTDYCLKIYPEIYFKEHNDDYDWELGIYKDYVKNFHDVDTIYNETVFPNPEIIYVPSGSVNMYKEGEYISFDINEFISWLGVLSHEGELTIKANNFEKVISEKEFNDIYNRLKETKNINDFLIPLRLKVVTGLKTMKEEKPMDNNNLREILYDTNTEDLINAMTDIQKEAVYRSVWKNYVKEDVESTLEGDDRFEELTDDEYESMIDSISERYVYDGDYDCNLSYWDNINNLIDEEADKLTKDDIEM